MQRLAFAIVPLSLAFAGAAFAQSSPPATGPIPTSPSHASSSSAMTTPSTAAPSRAAAPAPRQMHMRPMAAARGASSPAARRMTTALNLLEAKGYGDFKDFHAVGTSFDASVAAAGKDVTVSINPDTGQVTSQPG